MTTLRLTLFSLLFCGLLYTAGIFAFAQISQPEKANGSLVYNPAGQVIGSRLIAQNFTSDRYFHPRPSACDFNAQAACGSNFAPSNPALTERAQKIIAATGASEATPIPADLVTSSGSGLDPHITRAAALFQIERIAKARRLDSANLQLLIPDSPLVNVLDINLALDHSH
ncbi:MAG: potassium-transporting ATPase subunit C [Luteolibacter sp.]